MIVKIDNKEYKIEKLALGRYAELLDALDKIPQYLEGFEDLSEEKILQSLPKMVKGAFPELLEILSIGSGIPKETIENEFGLTDIALVIKAIYDVNNFKELGKVLGELLKRPKKVAPEINTGLTK